MRTIALSLLAASIAAHNRCPAAFQTSNGIFKAPLVEAWTKKNASECATEAFRTVAHCMKNRRRKCGVKYVKGRIYRCVMKRTATGMKQKCANKVGTLAWKMKSCRKNARVGTGMVKKNLFKLSSSKHNLIKNTLVHIRRQFRAQKYIDAHQYHFSPNTATMAGAQAQCKSWGGSLINITSIYEQRYLNKQTANKGYFWIGLNDIAKEGTWRWANRDTLTGGETAKFTFWGPGQPSNQNNNEDCVHLNHNKDNSGRWNDINCAVQLKFICKQPKKKVRTMNKHARAVRRARRGHAQARKDVRKHIRGMLKHNYDTNRFWYHVKGHARAEKRVKRHAATLRRLRRGKK